MQMRFMRIEGQVLSARIALGALLIKGREGMTDRGTVEAIQENPYMQFVIGLQEFTEEPAFDGAKLVFEVARGETRLETIWADGGYQGKLVELTKQEFGWELEIVKRSDAASGFTVLQHRWIVERAFDWLGRYRLFRREHEATIASSRTDVHIAMTHIMLRRLRRPPKPRYENEHLLAHIT